MRLFADTGNLEQLRELKEMGVISGVTTNPTIASREGQSLSKTLSAICELFPDKPVFGQVVETEKDKIIAQALKIGDIAQNIVVKIPATEDGIKAIAALKAKNRRVCATTVLTSAQALMAAAKTAFIQAHSLVLATAGVLLLLLAAGIWRSLATVAKPQSAL